MAEKVLVNLKEALTAAEGGFEDPMSRYNGGWTKLITALDKSHDDGYSLVGGFVRKETVTALQEPGLYLDKDIGGSRKNQRAYYTLFELKQDATVRVLATLQSDKADWAIKLWPHVEKYFGQTAEAETSAVAAATYEQLKAVADAAHELEKLIRTNRVLLEIAYQMPGFDETLCWLELALDGANYPDEEAVLAD